jgi:MFS family permease
VDRRRRPDDLEGAATVIPTETEPAEQSRTLRTLVIAQVFSGAGLAAGVTVGALLAEDMLGTTSLAGIPAALFTTGSAAAAITVGRVSNRLGRRTGLTLGYAVGALGSVAVVAAATLDSVPFLLAALLVYGAGTATNLQARYAGADLASSRRRGRAVSTVLVATTLGAVVGPNLVTVMGGVAESVGIPRLAGPFLLAAAGYGTAGAILFVRLRPDPLLLARDLAADNPPVESIADRPARPSEVDGVVAAGASVMVITQIVMVGIMTMTPVHMKHHGHGVGATGIVISAHIAGMYLPSPLSGRLVDRFGPRVLAHASGATLLLAGVLAGSMPVDSVFGLAVALAVLGLGWNLGLVAGTAIITAAVPLAVRARTQGSVDLCIAVAGAGGGLGSGLVVSSTSYTVLAVAGAVVALAIVPIVSSVARSGATSAGRPDVAPVLPDPATVGGGSP